MALIDEHNVSWDLPEVGLVPASLECVPARDRHGRIEPPWLFIAHEDANVADTADVVERGERLTQDFLATRHPKHALAAVHGFLCHVTGDHGLTGSCRRADDRAMLLGNALIGEIHRLALIGS